MKKLLVAVLAFILVLSGCKPSFQKDEEIVKEQNDDTNQKSIVPKYKISDQYYQTILPFEASEARGLTVEQLNTRYDIDEFELGLMRVAQNQFDTDKYLFQEGQYLDRKTVKLWLNRKYTKKQLKEKGLSESENIGLNPVDEKGDGQSPIYLASILEHDYLVKDKGTAHLSGVVIGLALNSVYYYQKEKYGATYDKKISHSELEQEGKKIAQEVLTRLRQTKGLTKVPIVIALFEQESKSSIVPGNYFAYSVANEGSSKLGNWEKIDEEYALFPSDNAKKNHRDDESNFEKFKEDVEEYFPNFNGVIGTAFYAEDQLQELNIQIPIQFYGKAETVGFTQYVAGLVLEYFPNYISVEVNITSVNGQEALIVREADEEKPFVHIYRE